jgi:hypothetical protein
MYRRILIASTALALALVIGGCGSGDSSEKSSGSSSSSGTQEQVRDDAVAKAGAREAVSQLEACYVDQMNYGPCASSVAGERIKAIGTTTGYTITATSKSGDTFVMAKADDGSLTRTCTPAGKGGCPPGGAW